MPKLTGMPTNIAIAEVIKREIVRIDGVVDARIIQRLDYPQFIIDVDRAKVADLGLSQAEVMKNVGEFRLTDYSMEGLRFLRLSKQSGLISYKITEKGIKDNLEVGLIYCEAWLRGIGCSPINGLMEDAATAEISVPHPHIKSYGAVNTDFVSDRRCTSMRDTM